MASKKTKPQNIREYIKLFPKDAQKRLREMYSIIKKAAPDANEGIKWGMPAFSYKRILVMFGGFKYHVGLFPTGSVTKVFAKELSKYKTGKGSIQFPLEKPIPVALITKMTKYRIKESKEKDKKWRT